MLTLKKLLIMLKEAYYLQFLDLNFPVFGLKSILILYPKQKPHLVIYHGRLTKEFLRVA